MKELVKNIKFQGREHKDYTYVECLVFLIFYWFLLKNLYFLDIKISLLFPYKFKIKSDQQ